MKLRVWLKYLHLAYLSKPPGDRVLYRLVRRHGCRKLMQIGIGDGTRALRLVELAQAISGEPGIRYTGIDLFEARDAAQTGLSIKEAHRLLHETKATIQLAPGDPFSALARVANALPGTELVVVSADVDRESLARAWFYLPRCLAAGALVLVEQPPQQEGAPATWQTLSPAEVSGLASAAKAPRRAA